MHGNAEFLVAYLFKFSYSVQSGSSLSSYFLVKINTISVMHSTSMKTQIFVSIDHSCVRPHGFRIHRIVIAPSALKTETHNTKMRHSVASVAVEI